jgi:acyl transferase domain-containing protein
MNDAVNMDYQHKLGLLTATEALENAGIDFANLSGTDTGVFAGILSCWEYLGYSSMNI